MTKNNDIIAIGTSITCTALFVLAINLPLLLLAIEDEGASCMEGTRAGLNLELWAKIVSLEKICLTFYLFISFLLFLKTQKEILVGTMGVLLILDLLFTVMMSVWGIVILATNENNDCVAEGKGVAVMSIIWIVLGKISLNYQSIILSML